MLKSRELWNVESSHLEFPFYSAALRKQKRLSSVIFKVKNSLPHTAPGACVVKNVPLEAEWESFYVWIWTRQLE